MRPNELFYSQDEELIATLGQSYLASIISEQGMTKSSLVLSSRRLYQTGKIYQIQLSGLRRFKTGKGKIVVSIEDITGTSFQTFKNPLPMINAALFVIISFILIQVFPSLFLIALLTFIGSIIYFFSAKKQLFVIEYLGKQMGVPCNWYSESEISEFQKAITLEKDKYKKRN